MSLSGERIAQLQGIATNLNLLTPTEKELFNGYYTPDIIVYGCVSIPSANVDVEQLSEDCEGLSYEEIEFLSHELENESPQRAHIGIKPNSSPSGSPSGNK